jgi:hypothetical protein
MRAGRRADCVYHKIFQGVGCGRELQKSRIRKANQIINAEGGIFSDCERELVSNGLEQS